MCGRFALTLPHDAMAQLFEAVPANDLPQVPNLDVRPTDRIHAVISGEGARRLVAMRWGFLPHWFKTPKDKPLLINARAETVAEKPAFRAAYRARRCLVPASGYYEWTKEADGRKKPWFFEAESGAPLAFAGLWQDWAPRDGGDTIRSCTIITTAASQQVAHIHHRMPVAVSRDDWGLWLGDAGVLPDSVLSAERTHRATYAIEARAPR